MKIYTKTGDSGQTSLYGGTRIAKTNIRVAAYGAVDELNSLLGLVISENNDRKINGFLMDIQSDLFVIGSHLAGAVSGLSDIKKRVTEMEKLIDSMDRQLPELKNFILPGGAKSASLLFYARAVVRRTERDLVALNQKEGIDPKLLVYFNRLSDSLFEMARYVNFKNAVKEIIWKSR